MWHFQQPNPSASDCRLNFQDGVGSTRVRAVDSQTQGPSSACFTRSAWKTGGRSHSPQITLVSGPRGSDQEDTSVPWLSWSFLLRVCFLGQQRGNEGS